MNHRRSVLLSADAREAVNRARAIVDEIVAGNQLAYAITTGVGKLSDVPIPGDQIRELQVNLVRSHAVGVGEPLSVAETRAMMLLRANSLAKGYSGVRAIVIDTLCEMLNRGVTPFVPSQGSVGASGDLAPLAHLALALIGEGECVDEKGARIPSGDALKRAQIKPLVLEAKEAVSLINGTQAMLAVGTLALLAAETLVDSSAVVGGTAGDALQGTDTGFDERIHKVRPHRGQIHTAANLRRMLEGSQIRESHRDCGRVQDAYSLRCIPQVHGAVRDTLAQCREVFETEANSAVDNPLVFIADRVDKARVGTGDSLVRAERSSAASEGEVISGGNFHGEPVAFALDFLAIALSALAGISERRIERLAHPASVDSITTSGNKEDYVSMGMTAANKLKRVVENTRNVLAIEAMAAAQALDFYLHAATPLKTSKRGQAAHAAIRSVCATMDTDRVMYQDFARLAELIASGKLAEILR